MENGTVTERSGNYSTFMEQKKKMREFFLREQFRLKQEIKRETAIADKLKSMSNISGWKSRLKNVERLKAELSENLKEIKERNHLYRTVAPKVNFGDIKHMSAEIAMASGLSKYFGDRALFKDVEFLIRGGEKVGIIGPNGCGKTTLINILLGRDTDFKGTARLGEWVRFGYLGQEINFEDEERTIIEELLSVKEMSMDAARDYLSRFQFYGDEVDKQIKVLSGGERVRLYLGCMMLENPDCLIMDEPTNHLDVPARDALESALLQFKGTVIAVSHDRYFLNRCVSRILEFCDGTVKSYNGNYENHKRLKAMEEVDRQYQGNQGSSGQKIHQNKSNQPRYGRNAYRGQKNINEKIDIKQIEEEIIRLEERKKELENSFGADTPPEKYEEYDKILKELERLYELYE